MNIILSEWTTAVIISSQNKLPIITTRIYCLPQYLTSHLGVPQHRRTLEKGCSLKLTLLLAGKGNMSSYLRVLLRSTGSSLITYLRRKSKICLVLNLHPFCPRLKPPLQCIQLHIAVNHYCLGLYWITVLQ